MLLGSGTKNQASKQATGRQATGRQATGRVRAGAARRPISGSQTFSENRRSIKLVRLDRLVTVLSHAYDPGTKQASNNKQATSNNRKAGRQADREATG